MRRLENVLSKLSAWHASGLGVVCAVIVFAVASAIWTGDNFSDGTASIPASFSSFALEAGTIFAPSSEEAQAAQKDVERASKAFQTLVGAPPTAINVVIAQNPSQFAALNEGGLQHQGLPLLPFLSRAYIRESLQEFEVTALDATTILTGNTDNIRVTGIDSLQRSRLQSLQVGDRVTGLNGIPVATMEALREAYDQVPVGTSVTFMVDRSGRTIQASYVKKVHRPEVHAVNFGAAYTAEASGVLGHEACHLYVNAYADAITPWYRVWGGDDYGNPFVPDWQDEMIATFCESDRQRTFRLQSLTPETLIPLRDLFKMKHPGMEFSNLVTSEETSVSSIQIYSGERVTQTLEGIPANAYYAQVLAVGMYIHERGGPEAVQTLLQESIRGRSIDQALLRVHETAPSIPATLSGFEREWTNWLKIRK